MKKPMWFDELIQDAMASNDPTVIAQAIANSSRFLDAIKKGLARKPDPKVMGPSHAQIIAEEVVAALTVE